FYDFVPEGKGTYADMTENDRKSGVNGFLLLCVATNAHQIRRANEAVADAVKRGRDDGFEAYGFGGMHPCDNMEEEISFCLDAGLSGIKIHPDIQGVDIDDPRLFPLYEEAEDRFPVYFHMGDDRPQYRFSSPDRLARIMKLFPRLTVAAAHFGGYKASDEALEYLTGSDRIFFDTSSALWAMTCERAELMISRLGVSRVMFGTDSPIMLPETELPRFYRLRLTEKEREDVLYNNAKAFLS
ncbi:MAG: amidohydrolase family protein, partial [Clostridia bacterium]|nr:amidohydrolase family protein [Clostridia bacterium]